MQEKKSKVLDYHYLVEQLCEVWPEIELFYKEETVSTHDDIDKCPESSLCVAEWQSYGRGRKGDKWISQKYKDLLFSLKISVPKEALEAITVRIGFALCNLFLQKYSLGQSPSLAPITGSIGSLNFEQTMDPGVKHRGDKKKKEYFSPFLQQRFFKVKWPNDIYLGPKKLCGIIADSFALNDDKFILKIGIGINVNSSYLEYSSLKEIYENDIDRNLLLIEIIMVIKELILNNIPLSQLYEEDMDYLLGRNISVRSGERNINGIANGIFQNGNLLITTADGNIRFVEAGVVSYL